MRAQRSAGSVSASTLRALCSNHVQLQAKVIELPKSERVAEVIRLPVGRRTT